MAGRSSSGGAGTEFDNTESGDSQNVHNQPKLDSFRSKQLKVLQVLRATRRLSDAASHRSQSGAPSERHGKRLSRQATADSSDSYGYEGMPRSGSVPSRRVSFQGYSREHRKDDSWESFVEDARELHTLVSIQQGRIDCLKKSSQDAPTQTAELLQAAEARMLGQLGLPETEDLLQDAKGSVENFNVMDKKRSQDLQLAIDGLWDALRTQGRQIQGVRGLRAGIAELEKGIEAQAGQIGELQHAVQEIYNSLYWAWEAMEAQEAVFEEVAAQLQQQHREELQRIEFGLAIRERATDTLQVELESLRRREAAKRGEACGDSCASLSPVPSERSSLSSVGRVLAEAASASEAAGLGIDFPEETDASFD